MILRSLRPLPTPFRDSILEIQAISALRPNVGDLSELSQFCSFRNSRAPTWTVPACDAGSHSRSVRAVLSIFRALDWKKCQNNGRPNVPFWFLISCRSTKSLPAATTNLCRLLHWSGLPGPWNAIRRLVKP